MRKAQLNKQIRLNQRGTSLNPKIRKWHEKDRLHIPTNILKAQVNVSNPRTRIVLTKRIGTHPLTLEKLCIFERDRTVWSKTEKEKNELSKIPKRKRKGPNGVAFFSGDKLRAGEIERTYLKVGQSPGHMKPYDFKKQPRSIKKSKRKKGK